MADFVEQKILKLKFGNQVLEIARTAELKIANEKKKKQKLSSIVFKTEGLKNI